ncbi:2-hydroxychromene-2-carboxylate isomerase [Purpureocillium lavendulum]|uniref:2-hydroxychromene-2-carboxylate isomerase n=1 Tax=Purpureocillium lavendulum TaxID=1247861 RepID=A0AB34FRF5_9HYPO|nr:2-hydroxychromene-2-carboxylate isomerase [Purpureocillium lavendulum]
MGEFCLVPLDDKISVLENSIGVLEDIHNALQVKRDTINYLICDLADLDGKTHRLMMQIQLMVLSLKKEGVMMARYLANGRDDPINARILLGWQATAPGPHASGPGRTPVAILPTPRNATAAGRVAVEVALGENEYHSDAANPRPCEYPSPTATTRDPKPAAG